MNLLEHEMRIAALLSRIRIPGYALDLRLQRRAAAIQNLYPVRIDTGNIAVLQADDVLGIRKKSGYIGCHKNGRAAFAYHQGTLISRADDVRRAGGHHCNGIGALHLLQGF